MNLPLAPQRVKFFAPFHERIQQQLGADGGGETRRVAPIERRADRGGEPPPWEHSAPALDFSALPADNFD
jgi:hypothetical protein